MSEQTPDSSNGLIGGEEPSMEDILASIRKIIADDESDVDDLTLSNDLEGEAETSFSDSQPPQIAEDELETLDLDVLADSAQLDDEIDSLIADTDASDDLLEDILGVDTDVPLSNEPLELEIPDTKVSSAAGVKEQIGAEALASGAIAATSLATVDTIEKTVELEDTEIFEDDLSLMLDDMLAETDDADDLLPDTDDLYDLADLMEMDEVIDPAADLLSDGLISDNDEIDDDFSVSENNGADADMDLVKSLMADLTEDSIHDDEEMRDGEVIGEVLSGAISDDLDLADNDAGTDDVLDEILSLSLDDEIDLQSGGGDELAEDALSLKDIAELAKADANALESGDGVVIATGLAAMGAKVLNDEDDIETDIEEFGTEELELGSKEVDDDIEEALSQLEDMVETEPEPHTSTDTDITLDEEIPEMARVAKKDKIIDEVTETATADVFSSLNQVVEEKAMVAERGDRIGDLVQEALRPMLKEWLDKNLKGIVERAVTKEVKRISSGK